MGVCGTVLVLLGTAGSPLHHLPNSTPADLAVHEVVPQHDIGLHPPALHVSKGGGSTLSIVSWQIVGRVLSLRPNEKAG